MYFSVSPNLKIVPLTVKWLNFDGNFLKILKWGETIFTSLYYKEISRSCEYNGSENVAVKFNEEASLNECQPITEKKIF